MLVILLDDVGFGASSGFVHYQRNDLVQARDNFAQLVELRYLANASASAKRPN